jgi:hypothetical protein
MGGKGESASVFRAAWHGVTDHAVGGLGEVFAAPDAVGFHQICRNARRIGFAIVDKRHCRTACKRERPGVDNAPSEDTGGYDDDGGDNHNGNATHGG